MAAKSEYVVVDGSVQDGAKVVRQGEVYVPPNNQVRDQLVEEKKIVLRGKLDARSAEDDQGGEG